MVTGAADRVLGDWLREEAAADPDRPFVQCGGGWVTLAELDQRSDVVAAGLQGLGVEVGDRVAIILPNSIDYIVLVYAIAKAGAVQVPVNTYLRGEFLLHPLLESGATLAVCDLEPLHQVVPLVPKLPALTNLVLVDGASPDPTTTLPQLRFASLEESGRTLIPPALTPDDLCAIMYTSGISSFQSLKRVSPESPAPRIMEKSLQSRPVRAAVTF
ncbi:AMP-binding protein [Mycobacterium heckeshornense]|uniref:Uncharacterized protein n=1 Tax=Mycobacterium heckeshornense TaxID=110505 RepID=A0A2I3EHJ9_9MYCO|nr:AMP-binding protein [Mycobacterium heckeshornense]KMV15620.1 hypothetical protein ACT16_22735 [Mycobacterium heckeshornense]MCV7036246.1 AMP-binding protein [Mycobacterium heckeshornense]BCO36243.1 hypothetical protein MHEC_26760 [Mycobacterium heckeshornense]